MLKYDLRRENMNQEFRTALINCETNVDEVIERVSGDEELYSQCLDLFLQDQSMNDLKKAMGDEDWDAAFTAVHALKGVAGNMGFIPLFHATAEMVILIRSGRLQEVADSYAKLCKCYGEICDVIRRYN